MFSFIQQCFFISPWGLKAVNSILMSVNSKSKMGNGNDQILLNLLSKSSIERSQLNAFIPLTNSIEFKSSGKAIQFTGIFKALFKRILFFIKRWKRKTNTYPSPLGTMYSSIELALVLSHLFIKHVIGQLILLLQLKLFLKNQCQKKSLKGN